MNEILNKFLLVGDKFMSEMHLKQPGFTYSAYSTCLRRQETQILFTKMNLTRFVFNTIQPMANQKI